MPEPEKIVKARLHHGSNSLDPTIPSEIVINLKINPGDVFRLVAKSDRDKILLQYEWVYSVKAG
jgi:hypothetical protein